MARQLWLLRHADAEPHGTRPDSQRRLTPRGEQQARAAGIAIEHMAVAFDQVLFSPKVRARATAALAAEGWSERQRALLREHLPLAGGFDVPQALDALTGVPAQDGRLLLVGHEPDLSLTVGGLTGARIDLKKGGLAVVRLEGGAGARKAPSRAPLSQLEGGGAGARKAPSRAPLSQLEGGGAGARKAPSRAGLASIDQLDGASGELAVLMRPRELALIAGVPIDRD
jgi:phosphohistidine phosphatase